jgi:hypothetical protein
MRFVAPRPFANPDVAARNLIEIANGVEAVQDGRIYIERAVSGGRWQRKGLPRRDRARHCALVAVAT